MRGWGWFVHRHRIGVLIVSLIIGAAAAVVVVVVGGNLGDANDLHFEAARANSVLAAQLPARSSVVLVVTSDRFTVDDPAYAAGLSTALAPLRRDPRVVDVVDPFSQAGGRGLIAADGRTVQASFAIAESTDRATTDFDSIRGEITPVPGLRIAATGDVATSAAYRDLSEQDLKRAEMVSLPVALVLLLLVFGTVTAAILCLGVGVFGILTGLACVFGLSYAMPVTDYAVNITSLIGFGVAIDYSLFVVTRFREELDRTGDTGEALAQTMVTAGRAIVFSGLTVAASLCGLLVFNGSFLFSLGIAAGLVVMAAVGFSITFLAALLSLIGHRVNRFAIMRRRAGDTRSGWARLAHSVMRRPLPFLLASAAVLVLAGVPFLQLRLQSNGVEQLPKSSDVRQAQDLLTEAFPTAPTTTFDVVAMFAGSPVTPVNVAAAVTLAQRLAAIPGVKAVDSYVTVLGPGADSAAYQTLYTTAPLSAATETVLHETTGPAAADLVVTAGMDPQSPAATDLLQRLRAVGPVAGVTVAVGGETAFDHDFGVYMSQHLLPAMAIAVVFTVLLLFVLLRSVLLPFKAALMNILSISAAFGALVWTVQQGHLGGLLGFEAAPIDPTLPPIMFCLVFGLSMDYEVFLLTRMQEAYLQSGDNRGAVADGLQASGRLVTGAAAIMVAVFVTFALTAGEVVVKAVGLGIATAVAVDATIVRALVVPALMRLLGPANWWAPRWLGRRAPVPPASDGQPPIAGGASAG